MRAGGSIRRHPPAGAAPATATVPRGAAGEAPGAPMGPHRAGDRGLGGSWGVPALTVPVSAGRSHGAQPQWDDPEAPLPQGLAAPSRHLVQPARPQAPQVSPVAPGAAGGGGPASAGPLTGPGRRGSVQLSPARARSEPLPAAAK